MNKEKSAIIETMCLIIERMCGHINTHGETNYDNKSLENVDMMIKIINVLVDDVLLVMQDSKREIQFASVERVFNKEKEWAESLVEVITEALVEV